MLLVSASEVQSKYSDQNTGGGSGGASGGSVSTQHDDGSSSNGGGSSMNIWAVAAVAALGAMFLVIVLCTSILYCDWRKRKLRRERKREERQVQMREMQGRDLASKKGGSSKKSHDLEVEVEDGNFEGFGNLQIVVPASSGETEEMNVSPSTQGSNGMENYGAAAGGNNSGSRGGSKRFGRVSGIVGKSRRSMGSRKSTGADGAQAGGGATMAIMPANNSSGAPPSAQDYRPLDEDKYDGGGDLAGDGYSVGEDTTMLYPTINRGRTMSKDNMSFDGYSMDGMSAMDGGYGGGGGGGYSQYGGSGGGGSNMEGMSAVGGGGGGGSGVHSSAKGKNRDMYYTGEIPRDFDSVWDDESKLTMDGMSLAEGSLDYYATPAKGGTAAADINKDLADPNISLNKLVEKEYEESSKSAAAGDDDQGSAAAALNLHDFDSESESGSNPVAGAFTLELLGKGRKPKLGKGASTGSSSVAPSVDDDDSILGDMYRDVASGGEDASDIGGLIGGSRDGGDDLSAIVGHDDDEVVVGVFGADGNGGGGPSEEGDGAVPSSGDSVDSTPSWAAPIQSALRNSVNIFRAATSPASAAGGDDDDAASSSSTQEQRTKEKLLSSLHGGAGDDSSVGSNRSGRSSASGRSRGSQRSSSSRGSAGGAKVGGSDKETITAKSSNEKALGLTNSMEEEVDEDPAAMIDNINNMLSECREILDTDGSP